MSVMAGDRFDIVVRRDRQLPRRRELMGMVRAVMGTSRIHSIIRVVWAETEDALKSVASDAKDAGVTANVVGEGSPIESVLAFIGPLRRGMVPKLDELEEMD